eukprot:2793401-Amphidinium_carterae.2
MPSQVWKNAVAVVGPSTVLCIVRRLALNAVLRIMCVLSIKPCLMSLAHTPGYRALARHSPEQRNIHMNCPVTGIYWSKALRGVGTQKGHQDHKRIFGEDRS